MKMFGNNIKILLLGALSLASTVCCANDLVSPYVWVKGDKGTSLCVLKVVRTKDGVEHFEVWKRQNGIASNEGLHHVKFMCRKPLADIVEIQKETTMSVTPNTLYFVEWFGKGSYLRRYFTVERAEDVDKLEKFYDDVAKRIKDIRWTILRQLRALNSKIENNYLKWDVKKPEYNMKVSKKVHLSEIQGFISLSDGSGCFELTLKNGKKYTFEAKQDSTYKKLITLSRDISYYLSRAADREKSRAFIEKSFKEGKPQNIITFEQYIFHTERRTRGIRKEIRKHQSTKTNKLLFPEYMVDKIKGDAGSMTPEDFDKGRWSGYRTIFNEELDKIKATPKIRRMLNLK